MTTWKHEIVRITLALIALGAIGALFGQLFIGFCIILFGYTLWSIYHLEVIREWLEEPTENPPEAKGLWGNIYDGIYHLQRRDKEEKTRLKATIEYLQDSFSSLPDAVVMVDKRGNIEWSNKSAEGLLGLTYPNDQQQLLANLIRNPAFTDYLEKEDFQQYLKIPSPVSDYITLQVHITFFGKRDKLLFARDVTEVMQLERMREDFVGNVSHELRTPLTVIQGYLETFQDYPLSDSLSDKDRWQKALEQMIGQTQRMDSLVKDLLTLSQLETVPESHSPEKIDIGELTEAICNDLHAAGIEDRTITNNCPKNIFLEGNPGEIRSAITNLLTNAIKYTESDGNIWVSWEQNSNGCYFNVRDNGIGIGNEHLPRLTERFYRADKSRSIKTGGTGLGLAIVKHILIRHHAALEIQSELNIGSTFSIRFRTKDITCTEAN